MCNWCWYCSFNNLEHPNKGAACCYAATAKETCTEEVRSLMAEHGRRFLQEVSKRPASRDKDYRMQLARDKIPNRFLSQSWFMDQRQPEVQFCNDHATGLCKVCHTHFMKKFHWWTCCDHNIICQVCDSARINFESYRRAVKAACQCPAWACWCLVRFPNWLISQSVGSTIPLKQSNFSLGPSRAFIWSRTVEKG